MTTGTCNFQSSKTLDIVSRLEFEEIRQEMINVGGKDLQFAKYLYHGIKWYGAICILWWIIYLGWGLGTDKFRGIGVTLTLIMTIAPNMIAAYMWRMFMRRASENIQRMFDRQNLGNYNLRGVHWGTRQTLLYIYIRIFDQQLRNTGQFLAGGGIPTMYMHQTPGSSGFASPGEGRGLITHQTTGQHRPSLIIHQNGTMVASHHTEGLTPLHNRELHAPTFDYQVSNPQSDYPTAPQQNEYNQVSTSQTGYQAVPTTLNDYQMAPSQIKYQTEYQMAPSQIKYQTEYQMAPSQIKYQAPVAQLTDSQFIRSQIAPQKTEFRAPQIQMYPQIETQTIQQSEFGHIQIYPKIELQATRDIQIEMQPQLEIAKKIGMELSNKPTEQTVLEKTGLEKTGLELSKQTALGASKQNNALEISKQTALGNSKQHNGLEFSKQTVINESLKDIEEPPVIPVEARVQIPTSPDLLRVPEKHNKRPSYSGSRVEPSSNLFSENNSIEDPSRIELEFPDQEE